MNTIVLFLMAITLNAQTGVEVSRKVISGPYDDVQKCSVVQQATGTQKPLNGNITVFSCVVLGQGDQST